MFAKLNIFCAIFLCFSTLCFAETIPDKARPRDKLDEYRNEELHLTSHSGVLNVRKGERMLDVGFFGQNAPFVFQGSLAAIEQMKSYTAMRISGTVLYGTGMGGLIAVLGILVADAISASNASPLSYDPVLVSRTGQIKPLFWGLLIPSAIIGIVGGTVLGLSDTPLSNAIDLYNEDLYRRLRR